MKSFLALVVASSLYLQTRSYPVTVPPIEVCTSPLPNCHALISFLKGRTEDTCGFATVPLLRGYSPDATDHFYTTSASEMENAIRNDGYQSEGDAGQVFSTQVTNSVPLYRLWSPSGRDHFYTTSESERDNAASELGYTYEGIAAYVYPSSQCGAVPLYRTENPTIWDHFYTTDVEERNNAITNLGYVDEGIAAYVIPNPE
ncbi:hypothetical protein GSI_14589 [Ganoderma sinense ZZ0214-1]|uniref:DUF5648 domain-containing protein n=1 Tax=Ganoderma sinense ZZ0214-1 TaxID=1077348 RepID=A0A2G8RP41_9APHY|nr:hypothetical protein GSI_14589 [Ganoderma sinense ZZ0214-1]